MSRGALIMTNRWSLLRTSYEIILHPSIILLQQKADPMLGGLPLCETLLSPIQKPPIPVPHITTTLAVMLDMTVLGNSRYRKQPNQPNQPNGCY